MVGIKNCFMLFSAQCCLAFIFLSIATNSLFPLPPSFACIYVKGTYVFQKIGPGIYSVDMLKLALETVSQSEIPS